MSKKYSLFIGRWQPPHNGHMYIIRKALDEGKNVAIGLRETDVSSSDPYTLAQRMSMFGAIFQGLGIPADRYIILPVPDIESVNIGRKVGYDVNRFEVPEEIAGISATEIREGMLAADTTWKDRVPQPVADYLLHLNQRDKIKAGVVVWMTGLPCSGKTTISDVTAAQLRRDNIQVQQLDGDILRKGLCAGLGFSKADRDENLRRVACTAKMFADAGFIVLCSFVSPMLEQRDMVADIVGRTRFLEVHVYADADTCRQRDVKGMWAKADAGKIKDFTGHSAPYEQPIAPYLTIYTRDELPTDSAAKLLYSLGLAT